MSREEDSKRRHSWRPVCSVATCHWNLLSLCIKTNKNAKTRVQVSREDKKRNYWALISLGLLLRHRERGAIIHYSVIFRFQLFDGVTSLSLRSPLIGI